MPLARSPLPAAIALMVCVLEIVNGPLYSVEAVDGVVPSVV
jgi:hypothetical protein